MVKKCDKCNKEISEEGGTGLIGALQGLGNNFGSKSEFTLCKLCSRKFEVHKIKFFDEDGR